MINLRNSFFLALSLFLHGCADAGHNYICFVNPDFKEEKLCYEQGASQESEKIARQKTVELFEKIDNPGPLVQMKGQMKTMYSAEQFSGGLTKYYSNRTSDDIEQILSAGNYSSVYLKDGTALVYSHIDSAFVFDFEEPLIMAGAQHYFSKGHKPKKLKLHKSRSNCTIENNGIVYFSPQRDSFYFTRDGSYCTYYEHTFVERDSISVWPIDQVEKTSREKHYLEFSRFLCWLKFDQNKLMQSDEVPAARALCH